MTDTHTLVSRSETPEKFTESKVLERLGLSEDEWSVEKMSVKQHLGWVAKEEWEENARQEWITNIEVTVQKRAPEAGLRQTLKVKPEIGKKQFNMAKGFKTIAAYPDQQIGFKVLEDGSEYVAVPTHDPAAMATANEIALSAGVSGIVNLGDCLDFPNFGRFDLDRSQMGYQAVQSAIDAAGEHFQLQAEILKKVKKEDRIHLWIAGNHDYRLAKDMLVKWPEGFGLRRATKFGESPVMSLQFLLGVEDIGMDYLEYRPGGLSGIFLEDTGTTKFVHGDSVSSKSTAAQYVNQSHGYNILFGHVHGIEQHWETQELAGGARVNIFAASPGSLCKTDGAVPSFATGISETNSYKDANVSWQQGVALLHYIPGVPYSEKLEIVQIDRGGGALMWGKMIEPPDSEE